MVIRAHKISLEKNATKFLRSRRENANAAQPLVYLTPKNRTICYAPEKMIMESIERYEKEE